MGFDISNVPMTTITGVGPMNGLNKFFLTDFIPMASEALGVVDELLPFFPRLWRLGHDCGFGTLFFRNRFCGP
jgi:hypothetical protein